MAPQFRVAEFFAGIGLVRAALQQTPMTVVWSNDIEATKHEMFERNFGQSGGHTYVLSDIRDVRGEDVARDLSLAWASFPCTDLSLAGGRRGLNGRESSTFFEWIRVLAELGENRPPLVAVENVVGFATSHGGDDLRVAITELNRLGYSIDVLAIDLRRFLPQSRPRLFLIGSLEVSGSRVDDGHPLRPDWLDFVFEDGTLVTHRAHLPSPPPPLTEGFSAVAERLPPGDDAWWDADRQEALIESLSSIQSRRLEGLRAGHRYQYRTAYRRTRRGVATWEIRGDDVAGCLRTARGGSSRQAVVRAGRGNVRVRWMTGHEYAVLMGAGDYKTDGLSLDPPIGIG